MAVIAHAEDQHVDHRQLRQQAVGLLGRLFQVGTGAVQAQELRLGRLALQQVTLDQTGVAVGVFDRYPALVGQADHHARPVQHLLGQVLEKRHRAAATGNHQGRGALGVDRVAQLFRHVQCQAFSQQHRALVCMGADALRQFQIRYRHTTTSRPA
ncbi:hypothetical protein D3C78_1328290 [compost metagenome]